MSHETILDCSFMKYVKFHFTWNSGNDSVQYKFPGLFSAIQKLEAFFNLGENWGVSTDWKKPFIENSDHGFPSMLNRDSIILQNN